MKEHLLAPHTCNVRGNNLKVQNWVIGQKKTEESLAYVKDKQYLGEGRGIQCACNQATVELSPASDRTSRMVASSREVSL